MVRHFPRGKSPPILSHTFVFAFVVAIVAIVSFLCGKKKTKRTGSSSNRQTTKADENTELLVSKTSDPDHTIEATYVNVVENNKNDSHAPPESTIENENKELPPPPRLASIRASSYHVGGSSRSQGAKLTSSMSMRLSGPLKGLKKGAKKQDEKRNDQILENDNKLTREDSVWKKTIILGEKCKIPDEDEDDIILDENGQRITTFHRKPSCSSMSRQSSYMNQDVIRDEQQNRKDDLIS